MLVVTSGVGIWAVFSDEIGEIQVKTLITTNAILMTLGIISAWVLHVVQWLASRRPGPGHVMYPRCGTVLAEQLGDMQCSRCSTVFVVKA